MRHDVKKVLSWSQKHVITSKSSLWLRYDVMKSKTNYDVKKFAMRLKSSSWCQKHVMMTKVASLLFMTSKRRHVVKNTSWRQKYVMTSKSSSCSQKYIMMSKRWSWSQKHGMTSKSSLWLQKHVMTSKNQLDVKNILAQFDISTMCRPRVINDYVILTLDLFLWYYFGRVRRLTCKRPIAIFRYFWRQNCVPC